MPGCPGSPPRSSSQGTASPVLDKEKRHGGRPEFRADGAASPFDFAALKAYTGIDISAACRPADMLVFQVFGKRVEIPSSPGAETYMVERGARSRSIDKSRNNAMRFVPGYGRLS